MRMCVCLIDGNWHEEASQMYLFFLLCGRVLLILRQEKDKLPWQCEMCGMKCHVSRDVFLSYLYGDVIPLVVHERLQQGEEPISNVSDRAQQTPLFSFLSCSLSLPPTLIFCSLFSSPPLLYCTSLYPLPDFSLTHHQLLSVQVYLRLLWALLRANSDVGGTRSEMAVLSARVHSCAYHCLL